MVDILEDLISKINDPEERLRFETALKSRDDKESHIQGDYFKSSSFSIAKSFLSELTRRSNVGMAIIDREYRTVWANKMLEDIFGNSIYAGYCHKAYNQKDKVCDNCGVREIFEKGGSRIEHEQQGVDRQGAEIWSKIIATPINDVEGNIIGALEVVMPITKEKRIEQRIHCLESTQRMAGGVAHGLNNLAAVVQGNAEYILEVAKNLSNKDIVECAQDIMKSTHRIAFMGKALQAHGQGLINYRSSWKVDDLAEDFVKDITKIKDSPVFPKPISIISQYHSGQFEINIDSDGIKEGLVAIGVNGIESMANGGTLSVATDIVDLPGRAFNLPHIRSGAYALISIRDQGCGIEPKHMHQIFEPFFTTKGCAAGKGLSLAHAYGVIAMHKGAIQFNTNTNSPNTGTEFRIYLPIEKPEYHKK